MGENTPIAIKSYNMERQHPDQPSYKKKARKNERDAEGGNEMINHGNIAQGLHSTCPNTMLPDRKPQAVQSQQREGEAEVVDVAATSANATDVLQTRNDGDIKIDTESPSKQSILELRNTQTCYRDLM